MLRIFDNIHSTLTSFVEDRLATLKNVIKEPELDGWNLYLGNFLPLPLSNTDSLTCLLYCCMGFIVVLIRCGC